MSALRVLVTGMTSQQVGGRIMLGYASLPEMYVNVLRDAGCEVEHRKLVPGESVKGYDAVICGLAPLHALGTYYVYPAMEMISHAAADGAALLFALDDWQLSNLMSGVRTCVKSNDRLFKGQRSKAGVDDPDSLVYKKHREWAVSDEVKPNILRVLNAMHDRPWPAIILPLFNWGDRSILNKYIPSREIIGLDMSPYCTDYGTQIPSDSERKRQWVMGSLSLQDKWIEKQHLGWPVTEFGGPVRTSPHARIPEPELLDVYAHSWGTMAAPYPHAGSGWYRHRFVHAMRCRSIMLIDEKDAKCIGPSWQVRPSQIESLSDSQLRELADAQYVEQAKLMSTKEQVQEQLLDAIRRYKP